MIFAEEPMETPPTAAVVSDGSCFRQIEFVGILKGTNNRNLAKRWVDFMLSTTFQGDPTDERKGWFSPALAEDLSGLPPAYIVTGALDLFLDEDVDYARRLVDAGVQTELHVRHRRGGAPGQGGPIRDPPRALI